MRILVTGATSMLGRHTAHALQRHGHEVRVFQRRPSGLDFDERLGSVEDRDEVAAAMVNIDCVVHLAARVGVVGTEAEFHSVNVDGTQNVVEAARAGGVEGMVFVSTPSVAHAGASIIGGTATPADPSSARSLYARTKAQAELLALGASSESFPVIAIRPHLVIGPGDTQLVGRVVDRARAGRLALVGSGMALIDTTWVDNGADALCAAVERRSALGGRAYVVSNGQPRTVRELVERILDAAGLDVAVRSVPTRAGLAAGSVLEQIWPRLPGDDEPPVTRFVAEQLSTAHWFAQANTRRDLKWAPAVSLEDGFVRLRSWFNQA